MPVSKKQLVRLIRLVAQLKENRYPNCTRFALEMRKADIDENLNLACSTKTIYRDIQVLKSDFEAPIKFDKKRNGYYLTHHDWNFTCPEIFEDTEMLAAVLGARVAEHIFPTVMQKQIRDAVDSLLTNNNPDFLNHTQVDSLAVIPSNRSKIDDKVFMPLFLAWQKHEVCYLVYKDSKGNNSERYFEPHTLIFYEGVWYTKGLCHTRKEPRTFVLARIIEATPIGRYFDVDSKIVKSANEEELFDPEIVYDVLVKCDSYLTNIIQTRPLHPDQQISSLADGESEIYVEKMSKYRLVTWIMRQCGQATIKRPIGIASEIKNIAELIVAAHLKIESETI